MAEHTIALMLALVRRICEQDGAIRRGEWNRTGPHLPGSLHGRTVGLVGYGRIGRLVAKRLRGFDVRILATDPTVRTSDPGVELVDLTALLAESDVVSLHAPLEPATAGLIGREVIRAMRSGAMLVNTARGGMVDEPALLDALRSAAPRCRGARRLRRRATGRQRAARPPQRGRDRARRRAQRALSATR